MDCFAEPVIRRRFAPTGWLAMMLNDKIHDFTAPAVNPPTMYRLNA